jgi:cullin-associated NEDD8-dissociated protein 1
MSLNDLIAEIKQDPTSFLGDETVETKVLRQVLLLVEDKISEVKNQAVKWYVTRRSIDLQTDQRFFSLGQLIKIIRESQMEFVVDKLIDYSGGKDEELRDISGLGVFMHSSISGTNLFNDCRHTALKTITSELPPDGKIATTACAKLTPKLLAQASNVCHPFLHHPFPSFTHIILQPNTPPETLIETLSILSILITRFPSNLSATPIEPLNVLAPLLDHQRPVVRKRAIITIAQFIPTSKPDLFDNLLEAYVYPHILNTATIEKQRTTVQLVAAIARHSASHIAPVLSAIVPGILGAIQREDDELRESGLQVHSSSSTDRITSVDVIFRRWKRSCSGVRPRSYHFSVRSFRLQTYISNTIQ